MQKCSESKHQIVQTGERLHCVKCLNSFTIKDPSMLHWLAGTCVEVVCTDRPKPIDNFLHVGNKYTHHTHKIKVHKGLVYCARCGGRATTQLRLLARECVPPRPRSYGSLTLRAINNDALPPGLDKWPDDSLANVSGHK